VKRFLIASILVALAPFATYANGSAQTAPPAPAPTATPEPKHRLFQSGPQFIAAGVSVASNISSEFRPGSTSMLPSFAAWQTGETTLLGRFHVLSYTDYRSFAYRHAASDPVATVGGTGFTTIPAFQIHDDEMESGGGIRLLPQIYAGLETFARRENTGYPTLHGIGYTVMLAPNPSTHITPYGWISYTPNTGSNYVTPTSSTALTYRALRYRTGLLINEPNTRLYLDLGVAGEDLHNRTNAPATIRDTMVTAGLGLRF